MKIHMAGSPDVRFELEPRVELLAGAVLLAAPKARGLGRLRPPYEAAMRRRLAPFAAHPAIPGLRALLGRRVPEPLFAELLLAPSPADRRGALTQAGGEAEVLAFLEAFEDLGRAARFDAFLRAQKRAHAGFVALARAESARAPLSPEAAAAYLRAPFLGTCRIVLSPLLPRAFYVNLSTPGAEIRVRNGTAGRRGLTFELDAFDSCPAHELTHTALTPLLAASRGDLRSIPGTPPASCNDRWSWEGCFEEHLVRALTLRVLAGEPAYARLLKENVREGYPFLPGMIRSLEAYERGTEPFAAFYPRLLASVKMGRT